MGHNTASGEWDEEVDAVAAGTGAAGPAASVFGLVYPDGGAAPKQALAFGRFAGAHAADRM